MPGALYIEEEPAVDCTQRFVDNGNYKVSVSSMAWACGLRNSRCLSSMVAQASQTELWANYRRFCLVSTYNNKYFASSVGSRLGGLITMSLAVVALLLDSLRDLLWDMVRPRFSNQSTLLLNVLKLSFFMLWQIIALSRNSRLRRSSRLLSAVFTPMNLILARSSMIGWL